MRVFPLHVFPAFICRSLVSSLCLVDVSNHMFLPFDQFVQEVFVEVLQSGVT